MAIRDWLRLLSPVTANTPDGARARSDIGQCRGPFDRLLRRHLPNHPLDLRRGKQVALREHDQLRQPPQLAADLHVHLIEEVGVESTVNSAGEANTALVLGKFLSPRLFVSYGISLTESINTLKLRYTISDKWVLKTEAGENQSADLEYATER